MSKFKDKERKLYEIASTQQGYFTSRQAIAAGYSYRMQSYHKAQGHWKEIDRGIYRLNNYPDSPQEDLVICSLWSSNKKPQAVISHETALSVYGLGDIMPQKIHCIIPPKFRKKSKAYILHRSFIKDEETAEMEGFRITKPLRTMIDAAEGSLSIEELEKVFRDAIKKGYFVPADVIKISMSAQAKEKMRIILDHIKKHPIF